MLRRIKRFLGFSAHAYFPNSESGPVADGSLLSTTSRKSTKSERKAAKKGKNKSVLSTDAPAPVVFHERSVPHTEIVIAHEKPIPCSASEADRQTIITDSLPYRDPSDKVFIDSPPNIISGDPESSSIRSIAGSESGQTRLGATAIDGTTLMRAESLTCSVYYGDFSQDTQSQSMCDTKSRELPVDCDIPNDKAALTSYTESSLSSSSFGICSSNMQLHERLDDFIAKSEEDNAMQQFNAELDSLLKKSAPPFQVSTARLPPMLKELPPLANDDSLVSSNDDFNDSKNNSVARILNESHDAMMRSPENKHLRSYGY